MENYTPQKLSIKGWAEADRPREKMMLQGRSVLSNAELIAILLGSGNREMSAVALAQQILADSDNNLADLSKWPLKRMMSYKGIGEAKAISIAAALELGRRRQEVTPAKKPIISGSNDAYRILLPKLGDLPYEEFYTLLLSRSNKVLSCVCISRGGQSGTVVDPKIVFRKALDGQAASIILAHNHPSGQLRPSDADISITKKLRQAGKTLDIPVLDHLIIGDGGYYSFADEGKLT